MLGLRGSSANNGTTSSFRWPKVNFNIVAGRRNSTPPTSYSELVNNVVQKLCTGDSRKSCESRDTSVQNTCGLVVTLKLPEHRQEKTVREINYTSNLFGRQLGYKSMSVSNTVTEFPYIYAGTRMPLACRRFPGTTISMPNYSYNMALRNLNSLSLPATDHVPYNLMSVPDILGPRGGHNGFLSKPGFSISPYLGTLSSLSPVVQYRFPYVSQELSAPCSNQIPKLVPNCATYNIDGHQLRSNTVPAEYGMCNNILCNTEAIRGQYGFASFFPQTMRRKPTDMINQSLIVNGQQFFVTEITPPNKKLKIPFPGDFCNTHYPIPSLHPFSITSNHVPVVSNHEPFPFIHNLNNGNPGLSSGISSIVQEMAQRGYSANTLDYNRTPRYVEQYSANTLDYNRTPPYVEQSMSAVHPYGQFSVGHQNEWSSSSETSIYTSFSSSNESLDSDTDWIQFDPLQVINARNSVVPSFQEMSDSPNRGCTSSRLVSCTGYVKGASNLAKKIARYIMSESDDVDAACNRLETNDEKEENRKHFEVDLENIDNICSLEFSDTLSNNLISFN